MSIMKLKVKSVEVEFGLAYLENEKNEPFIADWKTKKRELLNENEIFLCSAHINGYVDEIIENIQS